MKLIEKIITHGNLTDVAFIQNTLGIKFNTSYNVTSDGKPDLESPTYQSNHVRGSPFQVTLYIRGPKLNDLEPMKYRWTALLSFDNNYEFPGPNTTFFQDCLRISTSDIYSAYGNGFSQGMTADGATAASTQEQSMSGLNGSKLYLNIGYILKNNLVDHVSITQQP